MYHDDLPDNSYALSLARLATLFADAYTRNEVEAVESALRQHLTLYPQDRLRELDHGFPYVIEALKRREAEACRMGLLPEEIAQREQLLKSTQVPADITTPDAARLVHLSQQRLKEWLCSHSNDETAQNHLDDLEREAELIEMLHSIPEPALATTR
jgi:hypothetical protein